MNKTDIHYVDYSWNPVAMRCTPVGPGCANCWHLRMANRLTANPAFSAEARAAYAGEGKPVLISERLAEPMRLKKPSRIAVQFMGDLFHEDVPVQDISDVFDIMFDCEQHTFLVLTKRPERLLEFVQWTEDRNFTKWEDDLFPNVWPGVSAENQEQADIRIPQLLQVPAAVRYVSLEPMLGPVNLRRLRLDSVVEIDALDGTHGVFQPHQGTNTSLDWVIVGAESGPGARPMHLNWVRGLRDQCGLTGTPFFFKQAIVNGKRVSMPKLDGRVWNQMPQAAVAPSEEE